MRSYLVHVHGRLKWIVEEPAFKLPGIEPKPAGFFCHRYVLASDIKAASAKALESVRKNLDRQTYWLSNDEAELELEAEEVQPASLITGFLPHNRGHTFYNSE